MRKIFGAMLVAILYFSSPIRAQETPESAIVTVRIWWPDALYQPENTAATRILETQFKEFNEVYPLIDAQIRLKRSEGQGSIISTLLAAEEVAPGAIPDLVLLKRDDLALAVRSGVVKPIDDWVPDVIRDDLLASTLSLGQIDGKLYGLPYTLRVDHIAYRTSLFEDLPFTYETVLDTGEPFLIPGVALPNQAVNNLVLAQYLALGGRLVDDNGAPILDEQPLLEVLNFYEEGVQQGIFTPDILSYDLPSDYWTRFDQGNAGVALVSSSDYLQRPLQNTTAAPFLSPDTASLTILDGWMWALTTGNPEKQNAALEFLRWMMRADQQAEYSEALGVLPALAPAFRIWSNDTYTRQVIEWLPNSMILPVEQRSNPAAVQLQAAFAAVINGTSAEDAISEALKNLTSG